MGQEDTRSKWRRMNSTKALQIPYLNKNHVIIFLPLYDIFYPSETLQGNPWNDSSLLDDISSKHVSLD